MTTCCANLRAAQVAIASQSASLRRCFGPEYVSGQLIEWAYKHHITLSYIQPENPQQNAYTERYNRTVYNEMAMDLQKRTARIWASAASHPP